MRGIRHSLSLSFIFLPFFLSLIFFSLFSFSFIFLFSLSFLPPFSLCISFFSLLSFSLSIPLNRNLEYNCKHYFSFCKKTKDSTVTEWHPFRIEERFIQLFSKVLRLGVCIILYIFDAVVFTFVVSLTFS